jgi:GNAT superfamily N-acetyltransferase
MIVVRPLAATDSIETITTILHRAYAQLAAMGLNYTAVNQTAEVTRKRFDGGQGFVAIKNEAIVGTVMVLRPRATSACAHYRKPNVATIAQLGVEPTLQGEGIGRALIAACEAWALEHGLTEAALDTAEQATHLIALYSRLGYEPCDFVRHDGKVYRSVVMTKRLQ